MKLRKKLFLLYFLPLILLITVSVLYALFTELSLSLDEPLLSCYFKETFHLYCPGCGGSRSLVALLKLDLVRSFILFPPLPISVIILSFLYLRVFLSFIKNDEGYIKGFHQNSLIIIPIAIILHFILKNLLLLFGVDIIGDLL